MEKNFKSILHRTGKYFLIYAAGIIIFLALLYAASVLPRTERYQKNMLISAQNLAECKEGHPEKHGIILDYATDTIILSIAHELSPVTILTPAYVEKGKNDPVNTVSFLKSLKTPRVQTFTTYGRYWHGHSAVMRFAHLLFPLPEIHFLLAGLSLLLAGFSLFFTCRKFGLPETLAIGITLFASRYYFLFLNLQLYPVYFIGLLAILFLAWKNRQVHRLPIFFSIGMLCAYFDFLTAPVITLGLPMLAVCRYDMRQAEKEQSSESGKWKSFLRIYIGYPAIWFAGYVASWGTKILLTAMDSGNFSSTLHQILIRAGLEECKYNVPNLRYQAITDNFTWLRRYIPEEIRIVFFILVLAFLLLIIYEYIRKKRLCEFRIILGTSVIALIPVFVLFCTANHALIHAKWLTYRSLTITAAAAVMLLSAFPVKKKSIQNQE